MNGYNNAKLLRRLGVAADAACDETPLVSQPEWEEADLPDGLDALAPMPADLVVPDWRRPEWVISPRDPFAARRFPGQYRLDYWSRRSRGIVRLRRLEARLRPAYEPLRGVLGRDLSLGDLRAADHAAWMHGLLLGDLGLLFGRYDLVQAYAVHPILALIVDLERPFIAYEHGTMRELPYENTWRGRLLALSYRLAARVVITNADVIASARRLGLENTVSSRTLSTRRNTHPGDLRAARSCGPRRPRPSCLLRRGMTGATRATTDSCAGSRTSSPIRTRMPSSSRPTGAQTPRAARAWPPTSAWTGGFSGSRRCRSSV